jgi:CheY-like chemotaxis protein
MHALGAMAGGIAHDFNNILMVVQGYTQQLLHESQSLSNAERQGLLCNIISAAQDGAEMVERLREFHLPDAADQPYQALDLNRLITQAVAFTRPKWYTECRSRGCAVSVREELSAIPPIHGHPVELRELLTNLIFNAVDAMPNGGLLTLRTRREGQEVLLDVTDTGSGMTERVRHHCLDPFFTTKGTQSMGMGLSLVHEFAERHHASLNVESKPGQGTTFHLRFAADVPAPDESPDAASDPSVRLKILVVDDDKSVGELICQMLVSEGHEVSQRCDPHEALRDATARFFDVVVTDQSMPLMNGEDLAAALKTAQPNTRIILITGFGSDGLGRPSIDCVLSKPFSAETLLRAVAATLASPPTPASSPRETAVLTH